MSSRSVRYLLSLLSFAVVFLPGYITQAIKPLNTIILSENDLFRLIITRIPALILLTAMIFIGNHDERALRGLQAVKLKDWPMIALLVVLSLGFSLLIPSRPDSLRPLTLKIDAWWGFLLIIISALSTALIEEFYFRSWLLSTLPSLGWPKGTAILFSVALFAAGHVWEGWTGVILAVVSGTLYSLCFMSRRSIFPLIIAHTIHNSLAMSFNAIQ